MKNHTKGKWRIDGTYIVADQKEGPSITVAQLGTVDTVIVHPTRAQVKANTLLLLRAPKMYKAIKKLLRDHALALDTTDQETGQTLASLLRQAIGGRK